MANSKSIDYVNTRFSNGLIAYKSDRAARIRIDTLQYKYQCCGTNMWIDWTRGKLNSNDTLTDQTTTSVAGITTAAATTAAVTTTTNTTTTVATTPSTPPAITPSTPPTTTSETPASSTSNNSRKRDVDHIFNSLRVQRSPDLASSSRIRRQANSNYGGIEGLSTSFQVVLPPSCCTAAGTLTNVSDTYCTYQ